MDDSSLHQKLFIKRRFFKNTSHARNTFQYTCFLVFNFAMFCCFLFLFPSFIFVSFLLARNLLGVSSLFIKTKKQNKTKQILICYLKVFIPAPYFLFQLMISLLIVVLSCSTLCLTKPLFPEMPFLHNHTATHQSLDQDYHIQNTIVQPELEYIENAENEVTSSLEGYFSKHVVSNRTARDANNPCFDYTERKWDSCRQKYVFEVHCHSTHAACYGALAQGYSYPACKVVIGYPQAKFISKCNALQIDCQCAA